MCVSDLPGSGGRTTGKQTADQHHDRTGGDRNVVLVRHHEGEHEDEDRGDDGQATDERNDRVQPVDAEELRDGEANGDDDREDEGHPRENVGDGIALIGAVNFLREIVEVRQVRKFCVGGPAEYGVPFQEVPEHTDDGEDETDDDDETENQSFEIDGGFFGHNALLSTEFPSVYCIYSITCLVKKSKI